MWRHLWIDFTYPYRNIPQIRDDLDKYDEFKVKLEEIIKIGMPYKQQGIYKMLLISYQMHVTLIRNSANLDRFHNVI